MCCNKHIKRGSISWGFSRELLETIAFKTVCQRVRRRNVSWFLFKRPCVSTWWLLIPPHFRKSLWLEAARTLNSRSDTGSIGHGMRASLSVAVCSSLQCVTKSLASSLAEWTKAHTSTSWAQGNGEALEQREEVRQALLDHDYQWHEGPVKSSQQAWLWEGEPRRHDTYSKGCRVAQWRPNLLFYNPKESRWCQAILLVTWTKHGIERKHLTQVWHTMPY